MLKTLHYCQLICSRTFEICLDIYELDPARFLTAPGLAWQAVLKKVKNKIPSFN